VFDHLRVASRDLHPRIASSLRHSANFCFQHRRRQARFQNVGDNQRFWFCSGHSQIVDGSIDGEFADRAAGKSQRLYHEAVGSDGDLRIAHR